MKLIKLMKKQTEQLKKIDLSYMDITKRKQVKKQKVFLKN